MKRNSQKRVFQVKGEELITELAYAIVDYELAPDKEKEKWRAIISHIKWTAKYINLDIASPYWQEKLQGEMVGYRHIRQNGGVLSGAQPLSGRGKIRTMSVT